MLAPGRPVRLQFRGVIRHPPQAYEFVAPLAQVEHGQNEGNRGAQFRRWGDLLLGNLWQLESGQGSAVVTVLAAVAVLVASINVFGGFAVTRRMLAMFTRS